MPKQSKSFSAQKPAVPHLVVSGGGLSGEIKDLRADVEKGFQINEARTGFPELDWLDISAGQPSSTAAVDTLVTGRNLLQGQSFDTLAITEGAVGLSLFALTPGDSGITVQVVAGTGALGVTYSPSTKKLVITLASGGSTADAVATAVNADAAQTDGYVRATVTGAGTLTAAVAETPMAGGVGSYAENEIRVAGAACLPKNQTGTTTTAKWSDTSVAVTVPTLSSLATGDLAAVSLKSNGVSAQQLTVAVA